ncbi:MAG: flagellar basal body P-ring formation protein FlgA [Magnetococcales bacterium]|nr:flagellar basal body P-ring formation protein FlgA [Magnetococcales bacterium]
MNPEILSVLKWAVVALLLALFGPAFRADAAVLPRAEAAEAVRAHLQLRLDAEGEGWRIDEATCGYDLNLPDGPVTWRLSPPPGEPAPGRWNVPVTALVNDRQAAQFQSSVSVTRVLRVPVARQAIQRGEVIQESYLDFQETTLTRPTPGLVSDPGQIIGKAAKRALRPEQVLQVEWFEEPLVVRRGERVKVSYASRGLSIAGIGVAEAHGRLNEVVTVRNPESSRRFTARVAGPGEVRVDMQ